MTEEAKINEPVATASGRRRVLPRVPVVPPSPPDKQNAITVQCYKCGGPNHFAIDCRQPGGKSQRALPDMLLSVPTTRTCHIEVSRKQGKGREAGTTLSPHKLEEVLPIMKVKVNVYVDESIVLAARVKEHLYSFSLLSKDPEKLQDGARVLGLQVWGEDNSLYWKRGNKISDMPRVVMRWNLFSLCGKLVEHLPMGGWLCVAVAFIKRRASDVTAGWDDKIDDTPLNTMIKEVLTRVQKENLALCKWCVDGQALSVWVDASSLVTGMLLVYDGAVVGDACWLRPEKDSQHINLTELNAIIKGINLAVVWKKTTLHLFTDCACVHKWISDTLTGKARVQTKAACKILIRWRLDTIIKLVKEYALSMNVSLVKYSQNKADRLTRVPQRWLDAIKRNTGSVQPTCTASMSSVGLDQIKIVHRQSGHPGVWRTLYFVKEIAPGVSKATVKTIVRECEKCQSINPAPVHWSKGALNVKQTWHRVAMDITHCNGAHFLMVIDCSPDQFAIWRCLP